MGIRQPMAQGVGSGWKRVAPARAGAKGGAGMTPILVLDIETVPDGDLARQVAGDPDLEEGEALVRVGAVRAGEEGAFVRKPMYHRVAVIGVAAVEADGAVRSLAALAQASERENLAAFWTGYHRYVGEGARVVTWNGRSFDLPVLVQRALHHGVSTRAWWASDRGRYRHRHHLDLMDVMCDYRASAPVSQHEAAVLMGLPGKLGVEGADVRSLWEAGRVQEVAAYCACDVATLALLYAALGPDAGWCTGEEAARLREGVRQRMAAWGDPLTERFVAALDGGG